MVSGWVDSDLALIWAHVEARAAIDCVTRMERHYAQARQMGLAKTAHAMRRQLEGLSKLTREWGVEASREFYRRKTAGKRK